MIEYALVCGNGHRFDGWFASAQAFERQRADAAIGCPACASSALDKAPMAPAVVRRPAGSPPAASALRSGDPEHDRFRAAMKALRDHVLGEAEYVGNRFAEEARRIHYRETDSRGIYGEATREEAAGLVEEGIACLPLPALPEDAN